MIIFQAVSKNILMKINNVFRWCKSYYF